MGPQYRQNSQAARGQKLPNQWSMGMRPETRSGRGKQTGRNRRGRVGSSVKGTKKPRPREVEAVEEGAPTRATELGTAS